MGQLARDSVLGYLWALADSILESDFMGVGTCFINLISQ
jgi:hypothetical protein